LTHGDNKQSVGTFSPTWLQPSSDDVLHLSAPSSMLKEEASGIVGTDFQPLAVHCTGLLAALASHMQEDPNSAEFVDRWVNLLVYSSQLICGALLHMYTSQQKRKSLKSVTNDPNDIEKVFSFPYYVAVLTQCRVHLIGLLSSSEANVSNETKSRYVSYFPSTAIIPFSFLLYHRSSLNFLCLLLLLLFILQSTRGCLSSSLLSLSHFYTARVLYV
jgi:hypothetical protein